MEVDFFASPSYSDVRTGGFVFFLTRNQAKIVSLMHFEHQRGRIDIEGAWLLRKCAIECKRMAEVFRRSPAWQRLIVYGQQRGCYNLAPFIKVEISPIIHRKTEKTRRIQEIKILHRNGETSLFALRPEKKRFIRPVPTDLPLPESATIHPPCSVEKVDLMAKRFARGEALFHPDDFVPTDPVMIERYVFNGRRASAYKVAELLASSPRSNLAI